MKFFIFASFFLAFISHKSIAYGEIEWVRNGTTLNYTIISLIGGVDRSYNCKWQNKCWVEMNRGLKDGSKIPIRIWAEEVPYSKGEILSPLELTRLYTNYGLHKKGVINNYSDDECILLYLGGGVPMSWGTASYPLGNSCNGSMTPVPPPEPLPAECSLNGDIMLNHGVLQEDKVNGNRVQVTAYVRCSRDATVNIRVQIPGGGNKVMLRTDNSLAAALSINGNDGTQGVKVYVPGASGAPLIFSSTLNVLGNTTPGPFTGMAVAIMNII